MSTGKCNLCNKDFQGNSILRHLRACIKKNKGKSTDVNEYMLFRALSKYSKDYWMYMLIKKNLKLKDLDMYLRAVWLECCGHLSEFNIEGTRYSNATSTLYEFGESYEDMNNGLSKVFKKGMKADYDYDFGSTTRLSIEVLDESIEFNSDDEIILVAKNEKEKKICSICDKKNAEYYAYDFSTGEDVYFCDDCVDEDKVEGHIHPYINSPRLGVCACDRDVNTAKEAKKEYELMKNIAKNFDSL